MAEYIIDNEAEETFSRGTWYRSAGANPYGEESLTTMDGAATYTFAKDLSGEIEVYLWWTTWSSRCTNVPVEIYDGTTLLDTVHVNQQENGGKWNFLGKYTFSGPVRVVVSAQNGCSTCVDAVRLVEVVTAPTDPSPDLEVTISDERIAITECLVKLREGDTKVFWMDGDNRVEVSLNRYAIIPREEYEAMYGGES